MQRLIEDGVKSGKDTIAVDGDGKTQTRLQGVRVM